MPSEKRKDFEDTWAPEELHKSLKGKDDKKRSSTRDRDKDRERRKDDDRKSRTREGDRKDRDRDREKKERDREKDKDRERRHRDRNGEEKKRDRDPDKERRRRLEESKERSSKSKDDSDRRRHREDKDRDDKDRKRDRDDKERRRDRDDKKSRDDDSRRRRHREENGERSSKSKDDKRDRRHRDKDDTKEKRSKNEDESRHRRRRDETEEEREERRRERRRREETEEEREERRRREEKERNRSHDRRRMENDDSDEGEKKKSSSSRKKEEETSKREGMLKSRKVPIAESGQQRLISYTMLSPKSGALDLNLYPKDNIEDVEAEAIRLQQEQGHSMRDLAVYDDKEYLLSLGKKLSRISEWDSSGYLGQSEQDSTTEEDAYGDYEDDFEDYEDDFEDDDGDGDSDAENDKDEEQIVSRDEMDEILKAMNEENDRLLKESRRPKRREIESDEDDHKSNDRPSTASKKNFINFKSAKQRQAASKAVGKAARRGRELLQIVDLDFVGFDMFDMPPVNEYELYMRTYGQSDMKQTYVQTNEDNVEREIQTEEIESTEKWTQYPPEDVRGWGGGDEEEVDPELGSSKPIDSVRLSKFVTKAGSVMCVLLEEEKSQGSSSGSMTQRKSNVCVSDGFVELAPNPLLQGRHVSASWVSPLQTHMLLTVHTETVANKSSIPGKGLLCVWNLNEPSQPNKLLACEGQPRCCCFSPGGSTLAFAGMQDGSLAVWDLREQMSLHKMFAYDNEEYLLRYPTYNTAHVMSNSSHLSSVVSVTPIAAAGESIMESLDLNSDGGLEGSSSFQIASLEENSRIHLWVAAELSQPDPAGSESDLGLLPGGKVKLLPSSSIVLENPAREARVRTIMQSFDMVLNPKDPSHYYVATDTGCIIHGVRYGGKAPPRAYRGEQDVPLEVTSLDFSPFSEPVFLAGCADGSLRLYSTKSEAPIISWPNVTEGRPLKCVRWCCSRPSIFFVLDDSSNLQIWDLNMSDSGPLREEKVSEERVTSFVLTNDHSATGLGVPGRKPQMVVCLESGSIEVHTVSKEFSALMPEEVDQFKAFVESVM